MKKERINEMLAVLCFACGLFVFWSLLKFTPSDSALFTSHPNTIVHNGAGIIGAKLSEIFMFLFGLSSYTFSLIAFFWAVSFMLQRIPEKLFFKVLGFIIFQTSAATLLAMLAPVDRECLMGGVWGFFLSHNLTTYFGFGGGLIITIACFLLSFILATEFLIFPFLSKGFVSMIDALTTRYHEVQAEKKKRIIPDFTAPQKVRARKTALKEEKPAKKKQEENDEEDEKRDKAKKNSKPEDEEKRRAFESISQVKVKKYDPSALQDKKSDTKKEEAQREQAKIERVLTKAIQAEKKPAEKPEVKQEPSQEEKTIVSVFSKEEGKSTYEFPPLSLLKEPTTVKIEDDLTENTKILEGCLRDFDIEVKVTEIEQGPVITRYEILPAPGIKVSRITALQDDIALALKAPSIRIIAPIPGKSAVGIEVPNSTTSIVYLRELLQNAQKVKKMRLPLVLGKDTSGHPLIADLAEMPHILIAGSTGSGKTVCINAIIVSFFYCLSPDELKFIMVDPKRVEMAMYTDIPYMLAPVVVDAKKAAATLNWVVGEMENRYKLFASVGVRNIQGYNSRPAPKEKKEGEEEFPKALPYIVVIIDELADLMLVAADKVETAIARLAQLSRATGIHLILATQRPSVDVITGVIKANFPARLSFKVASKTDSRTVLDANGADMLLGKGDMLFLEPGKAKPFRAQATLISDPEINAVVEFIKGQRKPDYNTSIQEATNPSTQKQAFEKDDMYDDAVSVVLETGQASVSILQRRLRLGYTRAARIIDMMEADGIVGPYQGSKPREILVSRDSQESGAPE